MKYVPAIEIRPRYPLVEPHITNRLTIYNVMNELSLIFDLTPSIN